MAADPKYETLSRPEIRVLPSPFELFHAAADDFIAQAVAKNGKFSVALSGGSTPKSLYSRLATEKRNAVPWDKVYFFFGDERNVPPENPESNYRMAHEVMFSKVPVSADHIFRMRGEDDAEQAASAYEKNLGSFFGLKPGEFPRFDLIFLGMGPDGHTASLFPDSAALNETRRLVAGNWVEKFKTHRITLTFPVLNNAACVTFLTSGPDKAPMVHEVLENPAANLPCQRVHPVNGKLIWMMDQGAASQLSR
jgi:6-phosphogluconolactonase